MIELSVGFPANRRYRFDCFLPSLSRLGIGVNVHRLAGKHCC
jgi:hypothetical protein